MGNSFFALISRMRYIGRWGLMRNNEKENVQEHSHMVAVIAHALALIKKDVFGENCEPEKCAAAALYHDASEIITGDLPTPIKYHNMEISSAYHEIERLASERLLQTLPEELRASYVPLLSASDPEIYSVVKAADKLSAYIKCVEERKAGNNEFLSAERQIKEHLEKLPMPEVKYFLEKLMPSFEKNLDELGAM